MKRRYRGWWGYRAKRRCPHSSLVGIYGDAITHSGGYRIWCIDCGSTLDGPVKLVQMRSGEKA